MNFFNPLF